VAAVRSVPVARVPARSAPPIRHFASRSVKISDDAAQSASGVGRKALGASRRARSIAESNARLRLEGEPHPQAPPRFAASDAPPQVGPGSFWQKYRWQSTSDTGSKTSGARQIVGMTAAGVLAGVLVHAHMNDWTGYANSERVKRTVSNVVTTA